MPNPFEHDYDLDHLEKTTADYFGFDLLLPPRFANHFMRNEYEPLTARLIRQMCKGVDCFIDVGAHIGFYSLLVGLENAECEIFAFEPIPQNVAILKKNLDLHDIQADVYQAAVSDRDGRSEFQVSVASDNSGFVANPDAATSERIEVDVMALDSIRKEISAESLLIKIDTEGNEIKVLEGMKELISEISDLRLFIEFNPKCLQANGQDPDTLLAKLDELGLDVFFLDDDERRVERLDLAADWRAALKDATTRNLYCVKSDKSLNLCFFSHSDQLHGAEKSLLDLIASLSAKFGVISTVVLPGQGPLGKKLQDIGVPVIRSSYSYWCANEAISQDEIASFMTNSIRETLYLDSNIGSIKPDVIISNSIVVPWGALLASRLGLPHAWTIREFGLKTGYDFFIPFDDVLNFVNDFSEHIFVISNALKSGLFPDCDSAKCIVTYPSNIELQDGKTGSVADIYRYPDSIKLVLLGRVSEMKGQADAVKAVISLVNQGQNLELAIVGSMETTYARELKQLVNQEGMFQRIHFIDHAENVNPYIEASDIGLTCARNEAFGRVTVEYLISGKPVIGANSGGTAEIVDPGVSGYLYEPGNIQELAEKLEWFIENPDEIGRLGREAPENVRKKLRVSPDDEGIYAASLKLKGNTTQRASLFFQEMLKWQNQVYGYQFEIVDAFTQVQQQIQENQPATYTEEFAEIIRELNKLRREQESRYADIQSENYKLKNEILAFRATLSWQLLEAFRGSGLAGMIRKILRKDFTRHQPPVQQPVYDDIDIALATIDNIQTKIAPLTLDVLDCEPRVNIVIPMIDFRYVFGGYIGVFNLALALHNAGYHVRFVIIDQCDFQPGQWRKSIRSYSGLEELFDHVEVSYHFDRSNPLEVSERDRFLAISAWTAYIAYQATEQLGQERFVYLTQEYEPLFHDTGSIYNIVNKSYDLPHYAIYSSHLYCEYARENRIGVFASDDGDENAVVMKNAVARSPVNIKSLKNREKRRLLVYARPEAHAHRNMFEFAIMALRAALWEEIFDKRTWSFWGIGTIQHGKKSIPLVADIELKLLKRVSLSEYINLLPDYDIGLSLMASPHPSLPPLDMASAGILTVTNTFATKTKEKLIQISPNIIPVYPAVDEIKAGLAEAAHRVDDLESRLSGSNINWPRTWEDTFSPAIMKKIAGFLGEDIIIR